MNLCFLMVLNDMSFDVRTLRVNKSYKRMVRKLHRGVGENPPDVTSRVLENIEGTSLKQTTGVGFSESDSKYIIEQAEKILLCPDPVAPFSIILSTGLFVEGFLYKIDESHYASSLRDVTEQRKLEFQLQRSQKT